MTASTRKDRRLHLLNKYAHIPMSYTSSLHCSKRGPRFEWRNVLVPHATTIIDKMTSVYGEQLRKHFGKVWHLFIFQLKKLISGRQAAGLTAKTSAPEHDRDARREKPVPSASQKRTIPFSKAIRAVHFGTPTVGPVSFQAKKWNQRMLKAHTSKRPTEFHIISSASHRIYTPSPQGTTLHARR